MLEWVAVPPGDLPDPGIEPASPVLQADSLPLAPPGKSCDRSDPTQTREDKANVNIRRIRVKGIWGLWIILTSFQRI